MGMGRSLHHWGAIVPPLGSEGAVLMGMGGSFHHWGARERFLWGWGDRSTTGEQGGSSYGDGEIVPPLGSEGGEAPISGTIRACGAKIRLYKNWTGTTQHSLEQVHSVNATAM